MLQDSIRVYAPATVANVACGFDVLGFALYEPGDEIIMRKTNSNKTEIISITGDGGKLSRDASKNTAGVVVDAFLAHIGQKIGIAIELHKKMPLGSGLGSSAASAVAALFAINELMGQPLTRMEMLPFAIEAERIACGAAHADNVAPSLLGGFTLIRSYDPLDVVQLSTPADLVATVVHPHIEIRTEDARSILRKSVALKDAIIQWGNVGGLVAGLLMADYALIGRSLHDQIIEPLRALLIPNFAQVKQAALNAGALGCSISGSGPSIFALSTSPEKGKQIANAIADAFKQINIASDCYVSFINTEGPRVLD
ncbi:MAG: homoserine kinase [Cytophagales bacterium]|nr:homoserine kinase [Bernardetiaceae bacterium]MDW8203559.1 homoserine kinase [Cytophagales bacterium]